MREINLDDLRPKDIMLTYQGKEYTLKPKSTEELLEVVPIWDKYAKVGKKDLVAQLALSEEFVGEVFPDFPAEAVGSMTPKQMGAFMNAVMEVMGLRDEEEEIQEAKSDPKGKGGQEATTV